MASSSTRKRGSKQFWPRVRAQLPRAVVNSWSSKNVNGVSLLGFPVYKVGMTSVGVIDNFSHTLTKGTEINIAATVLEAPAVKVMSVRLFAHDDYGNLQVVKEVSTQLKDKHLARKLDLAKKSAKAPTAEELIAQAKELGVEDVRVKVVTAPSQAASVERKKPEVLELGMSGSIDERITFALEKLGQEVKASEVFKSGDLTDSHAITIGKGFQGAVKRFGVKLTSHKSEKSRRHAGNLGAWTPSRVGHTVPLAGQHGYHERTEWNKWILNISEDVEKINPASGFRHYGNVANEYLLVKGSIAGPKKRLVTLVKSIRPNKRYPSVAPEITYINK